MNRKIFNKLNISKFMNIKNNRIIFLIIAVLLLSALILTSYFLFFTSDEISTSWLKGTVYIDGNPAPAGIDVKIVFENKTISDEDGTNESGVYEIEVTDYVGESFELYVIYQGNMYLGSDEIGNPLSLSIEEERDTPLDVFVVTVEDDNQEDDGDDQSEDDDTTDNSNSDEGDGDDNSTDDDSGDNSGNDTDSDDDADDENGSGGNDDSDDDGNQDDENQGDDEDDEPSEDEDGSEYTYLFVEKSVWHNLQGEWGNIESIEIGGNVQFNITIIYNGTNLSTVQIIDSLPEGLTYNGNATVNGLISEPVVNDTDHSLLWNITATSNQNTTLFINYNATVEKRNILQNNVTVHILKNQTSASSQEGQATVYVYGELLVSKTVRNRNETIWNETTVVPLNETVRFNITIDYNGSHAVENITIMDKLPEGITYLGNATLNGESINPESSDNNRTLFWNRSVLYPDEQIIIEFDANISENATIENKVQVKANETIGKDFNILDVAKVTGEAPELFICEKTVKVNDSWEKIVNAYVGNTATFNVTVTNLDMNMVTNLAILDTFPSGLKYVNGSSILYFENETYYKEPIYNETTNTYFWIDFNQDIQDYFKPNDTLTLQYDVIILEEGTLQNHVQVNSNPCGSCDPLTGYDSATIIATTEFTVDIQVSEPQYVGTPVTLTAQVAGGESPFSYHWDTDNDSIFDDEQSKSFIKTWYAAGKYPISVQVIDNASEQVKDTVIVNVTIEPFTVSAGGPYEGYPDENISFQGTASGGIGNYSWFWNFGDGNVSTLQNPKHAYAKAGVYYVRLNVTDERNVSVVETTTATINEVDQSPPSIEFEAPINAIYIRGRPVFPFFRPLIFGPIEINVSADDEETSIESIKIYIEDSLVKSVNGNAACVDWNETEFGRRTITVIAENSEGIEETEERVVWKFF